MKARHLDARDRPGVGPGPRLDVAATGDARREGALQQDLREQRLGMDPDSLAEQQQPDEGKDGGRRGGESRRPPQCRRGGKGERRHRLPHFAKPILSRRSTRRRKLRISITAPSIMRSSASVAPCGSVTPLLSALIDIMTGVRDAGGAGGTGPAFSTASWTRGSASA